jgi:uncharacterized protein (TIGR03067 family)
LQGRWVRTHHTFEGRELLSITVYVVIQGTTLKFVSSDGHESEPWKITMNPRTSPKVLDVAGGDRTFRGVFRLEGDVLTICSRLGPDEKCRPSCFDPDQKGVIVETFAREKR